MDRRRLPAEHTVTRAEALAAAAAVIANSVSDLPALVDLLETAGQARLANALRANSRGRSAVVGEVPKPDRDMWLSGRVR